MTGAITRAQPRQLGYQELVSDVGSIPNTAFATSTVLDVAGFALTFTPSGRPVWVKVYVSKTFNTVAGANVQLRVVDGAYNDYGQTAQGDPTSTTAGGGILLERRITTLTPGTPVTLKVQARTSSGVGTLFATAPSAPAFIRAYEE